MSSDKYGSFAEALAKSDKDLLEFVKALKTDCLYWDFKWPGFCLVNRLNERTGCSKCKRYEQSTS